MHARTLTTWAFAVWVVGLPGTAAASDSAIERVSLTGLTTISVVVEGLASVGDKIGLSETTMQASVERRLKQAGVSVTPDADAYLYVHVTIADPGGSLPMPYLVDVSLMQEVTLPRGLKTRTPLQCQTWSLNRLGMADGNVLRAAVNDRVAEFVDQFVRAYQSVNPKP